MKPLVWFLSLWLALAPAWADGISVPGVPRTGGDVAFHYPPSSGGAGSPTWTPTDAKVNESCTFSTTCPVTVAVNAGYVVVGTGGYDPGAGTTQSLAFTSGCGSVSFTPILSIGSGTTNPGGLWGATVATGGSCVLTITRTGGGWQLFGATVGTFTNLSSTTPTSTCSGSTSGSSPYPCTSALTVPSSGFAIASAWYASTPAPTWTSWGGTLGSTVAGATTSTSNASLGTAGSTTPEFNGTSFVTGSVFGATWH